MVLLIYPKMPGVDAKFDGAYSPIDQERLEVVAIKELLGFYRMGFLLPVLKSNCQIQDCNP